METKQNHQLKRSLTMTAVVALGINGVIGQGIFLLPGLAAEKMGPASLAALALGGFLCLLIALCFAEVSSRFDTTGGAYIYTRSAFGEFVGFEVGWITCFVGIISWAALAVGFTKVLAHFIPGAAEGWTQTMIAAVLMTVLMGVNLFGAKQGAAVSTVFSVAKLIPIILFIVIGIFHVEVGLFTPFSPEGWGSLPEATMILLYAYVGFETLVVPAGEMQNPRRNVPIALMVVMAVVTVVYMAVLSVSVGTFAELAGHGNPVAAASAQFMGPVGGAIIAVGICVSVFGTNAGAAFVSPRRIFAMADRGDLPRFLAKVSGDENVPRRAIVLTWFLALLLTLTGSFAELAVLGVVARFMQYIPTCIALLVFRARDKGTDREGFRVPFGPVIPLLTVGLCLWLLMNSKPERLYWGLAALGAGIPFYFVSKYLRRGESES